MWLISVDSDVDRTPYYDPGHQQIGPGASHLPPSHRPPSHLPAAHRPPSHLPPAQRPSGHLPPSSHTYLPPSVEPTDAVYRTNTGQDVHLTCNITSANFDPMETRWERLDGRPLPPNSYNDHDTLIITRVNEHNAGKYRCNGYDNRGTVITVHVAELVLVPIPRITFDPKIPIHVTANENVDIYCAVEGEQPIHVSWHSENNRPLPP